jgi:NMD protein affecting ribosome stability and mRNA decay
MSNCERCGKNPASGVTNLCEDCWHEIEAEQHEMKIADGFYENEYLRQSENPNAVCHVCGEEYHTNIGHMCSD